MENTYIQNLISTRAAGYKAPASDVHTEQRGKKALYTPYTSPEKPKGHIVKQNPIQALGSTVVDLAKPYKYFADAVRGKGTDYSVGRVNDGAKMAGSMAIAAALASTASTTKAKAMEFVGFSVWFTSMALWPKIIGAVTNATYGVNISNQYVDSYGRKKGFFEDAQYIPWDLYEDKDLQKLGDKLGVPKNIENRSDAIKEKAKQVSIQGNTMMMLTAGFATPLLTALICNSGEGLVGSGIETYRTIKGRVGQRLALMSLSKTGNLPGVQKGLESIGGILGGGNVALVSPEKVSQLRGMFITNYSSGDPVATAVDKLLGRNMDGSYKTALHAGDELYKGLRGALQLDEKALEGVHSLTKEQASGITTALASIKPEDVAGLAKHTDGVISRSQKESFKSALERLAAKKLEGVALGGLEEDTVLSIISSRVRTEAEKHAKVQVDAKALKSLYATTSNYARRMDILRNYAESTLRDTADSKTANHWLKYPRKITNLLGFTKEKQLELINTNPHQSQNLIYDHIVELAKPENTDKFNSTAEKIGRIADKVVSRERKAGAMLLREIRKQRNYTLLELAGVSDPSKLSKEQTTAILQAWRKILRMPTETARNKQNFADAIKLLTEKASKKTGLSLNFNNLDFATMVNCDAKNSIIGVKNKIMNTTSSFYRPLLVMDRIKSGKLSPEHIKEMISGLGIDFFSNKGDHLSIPQGYGKFLRDVFGNLENILQDKQYIKLRKTINKYHRSLIIPLGQIEDSNNPTDYKSYLKNRSNKIKAKLKERIDSLALANPRLNTQEKLKSQVGAIQYKHLDRLEKIIKKIDAIQIKPRRSDWEQRAGKSLKGFLQQAAESQRGTNIWLRIVLYMAVPLAAVTLLAITQFGKKNKFNPDVYEYKKQDKN